jgi:hypothetical protein
VRHGLPEFVAAGVLTPKVEMRARECRDVPVVGCVDHTGSLKRKGGIRALIAEADRRDITQARHVGSFRCDRRGFGDQVNARFAGHETVEGFSGLERSERVAEPSIDLAENPAFDRAPRRALGCKLLSQRAAR